MENLIRLDPASALLDNTSDEQNLGSNALNAETLEIEMQISDLLWSLRTIKQVNCFGDFLHTYTENTIEKIISFVFFFFKKKCFSVVDLLNSHVDIQCTFPFRGESILCLTTNSSSFWEKYTLQENLIHDDQKLVLLASLSDSLEYLADSIERC
jgi:hypothetical protein